MSENAKIFQILIFVRLSPTFIPFFGSHKAMSKYVLKMVGDILQPCFTPWLICISFENFPFPNCIFIYICMYIPFNSVLNGLGNVFQPVFPKHLSIYLLNNFCMSRSTKCVSLLNYLISTICFIVKTLWHKSALVWISLDFLIIRFQHYFEFCC